MSAPGGPSAPTAPAGAGAATGPDDRHALERARDEAIAASKAKSALLAAASHEMRTPLHGVLATLDLLRTTVLDIEQHELVDVAMTSVTALVRIIDDVLDLQRAEAGRLELAREPCRPGDVARDAVAVLARAAEVKGLELRLVDDTGTVTVLGDPLRLRQVLVNLVDNAVKYTERGSVTVVLATKRHDGAVRLDLEVRDTGLGIPREQVPAVREPFVRGGTDGHGAGLGLALVDRLVALMGGRVRLTSEVGRGTRVRVRLHLPEVPSGRFAERTTPVERRHGTAVLVVDDGPASRELLVRQLARLRVDARAVPCGRDAVDLVAAGEDVGLVLVDVDMPGLDGPATCAEIRALPDPRAAAVPVLAVGGSDLARCRESGMDGYLDKPVDLAVLRRVVAELLGVDRLGAAS